MLTGAGQHLQSKVVTIYTSRDQELSLNLDCGPHSGTSQNLLASAARTQALLGNSRSQAPSFLRNNPGCLHDDSPEPGVLRPGGSAAGLSMPTAAKFLLQHRLRGHKAEALLTFPALEVPLMRTDPPYIS